MRRICIMNKFHNIRYGFMKFSWAFQQWQALMFHEEDLCVDDLRWWFFEYLNNWEGDYE